MRIVPLCLDSDPSLIPLACRSEAKTLRLYEEFSPDVDVGSPERKGDCSAQSGTRTEDRGTDPDDFSFWSEHQAKRICSAIKQAFDVEYATEVVVADANLSALANRILLSKRM
jgi:phosphatidylethanolamine N-methyltransferase